MKQNLKQGGFSDEVWGKKYLQDYLNSGHPCGYFSGNYFRKNVFDVVIEATLRARFWSAFEVAVWITSSDARHFQDNVDKKTTLVEFYELVTHEFPNYAKEEDLKEGK